jgi:hypothetical protein
MNLGKALEILVTDWDNLHEEGGTKLSVEEVVGMLNAGSKDAISPHLKPVQIAELIMSDLKRIPAALENAEKFAAQFDTPDELLDEVDLYELICELGRPEED